MTDIVEQLRAVSQDVTQPWKLCVEAADEIERLRKLYRWWEQLYHVQASEIEQLREAERASKEKP